MGDYANDPVLLKYKFPTPQTTESDKKRLAAINDKIEQEKASKRLIKSALSGQVMNKKIVFNNPIPKKKSKEEPKPKPEPFLQSKKLFDDDGDDDFYEDGKESFKLDIPSKRFNNSKESKIIELQSRFAHDPRFKIDDKFIEDDEDANEGDITHGDDLKTETEKELDMLEEVLGKPLKRKFNHSEEKKVTSSIIIPRYDPTKPESQKFKIRKVDKLEPYQLPADDEESEQIEKPEASKERFYEISETFKKDFNDDPTEGQSFSLTAMFGRPVADIPETSGEIGAVKGKRNKIHDDSKGLKKTSQLVKKSNLKQDSDFNEDDEEGEEEDSDEEQSKGQKKSKSKEAIKKSKGDKSLDGSSGSKKLDDSRSKFNKISNPLLKYERFCFVDNDGRLTNNTFYNEDRIKSHIASWKEKKIVMTTALTKKRRHFKHVSKLKSALETGDSRDKDLKLKYRIYKETTKKH